MTPDQRQEADHELVRLRAEVRTIAEEMKRYVAVGECFAIGRMGEWADRLAVLGTEK